MRADARGVGIFVELDFQRYSYEFVVVRALGWRVKLAVEFLYRI